MRCARWLLVLLAVTGCRVTASLNEKTESFKPLRGEILDGVPLARYLYARSALLIVGCQPLTVEEGENSLRIEFPVGAHGPPPSCNVGSAAALTQDGYYLTAGHNVPEGRPVYACIPQVDQPRLSVQEARVVWRGSGNMDLAVLHIAASPAAVFEWAHIEEAAVGSSLVSFGMGPAAGKTLALPETLEPHEADGPVVLRLRHSLPLIKGDSGGPLSTRGGRLIGINVEGGQGIIGGWFGIAHRPDPAWIAELIERDRQARALPARD